MNAKKVEKKNDADAMMEAASRLLGTVMTATASDDLSDEMARYVQALQFFKGRRDAAESYRAELESYNCSDQTFKITFEEWRRWAQKTDYATRCQVEDGLNSLVFALERCIRTFPCRTIGDLRAKMTLTADFVRFLDEDTAEEYAKESLELVRSIAAMFRN
jgi:hypothetical protein